MPRRGSLRRRVDAPHRVADVVGDQQGPRFVDGDTNRPAQRFAVLIDKTGHDVDRLCAPSGQRFAGAMWTVGRAVFVGCGSVGEGPSAAVSGSFALSPLVKNTPAAAMTTIRTTAPTIGRPVRLFIARALALRVPVLNVVAQNRFRSCVKPFKTPGGNSFAEAALLQRVVQSERLLMGRYLLLWLLGVPIPILLLIWAFGGLH
jgi:hypothetical protein